MVRLVQAAAVHSLQVPAILGRSLPSSYQTSESYPSPCHASRAVGESRLARVRYIHHCVLHLRMGENANAEDRTNLPGAIPKLDMEIVLEAQSA